MAADAREAATDRPVAARRVPRGRAGCSCSRPISPTPPRPRRTRRSTSPAGSARDCSSSRSSTRARSSCPGGRFRARVDQVRERREQLAQALVARGREEGARRVVPGLDGRPRRLIVEAAEAEHADMVLVGSHGRGPVGRLLLGSVSEYVVRNAPCPVLVVRPREGARSQLAAGPVAVGSHGLAGGRATPALLRVDALGVQLLADEAQLLRRRRRASSRARG